MNAMKRAHEIRKNAAIRFKCKKSEILFSLCLKMAWEEIKTGEKMIGEIYATLCNSNGEEKFSMDMCVVDENKTSVKITGFGKNRDKSYWIKKQAMKFEGKSRSGIRMYSIKIDWL